MQPKYYTQRRLEQQRRRHFFSKMQRAGALDAAANIIESVPTWNRRQGLASRIMFTHEQTK